MLIFVCLQAEVMSKRPQRKVAAKSVQVIEMSDSDDNADLKENCELRQSGSQSRYVDRSASEL